MKVPRRSSPQKKLVDVICSAMYSMYPESKIDCMHQVRNRFDASRKMSRREEC